MNGFTYSVILLSSAPACIETASNISAAAIFDIFMICIAVVIKQHKIEIFFLNSKIADVYNPSPFSGDFVFHDYKIIATFVL